MNDLNVCYDHNLIRIKNHIIIAIIDFTVVSQLENSY